jgi:glycosyltransferase involved in cell wall biosynthesis
VAADAAIFFDPKNPEQFSNRIRQLLPLNQWQEASARSKQREAAFSWDESAERLLKVLERL